ncbi:MAG: zinc ribbon domain-containing protein [Candidatus Methanoplasma sp.]|nr:zinc ribbon domain-containing protein [Candidatus Methanoplasma sp.]
MIYICPECGNEIPEDVDFCYSCGRKRDNTIRLDDSGRFIPPETDKCSSCGKDMSSGDLFCQNCGEPLSRTQIAVFQPKMVKYGWIGIALAFIPGAIGFMLGLGTIGIYGLGHLYFKKWGRGAMYLLLSAAMFYFRQQIDADVWWSNLIFMIITIFIYIMQGMEAFVLAFIPPKEPSDSS